jgi:hypothetical protein
MNSMEMKMPKAETHVSPFQLLTGGWWLSQFFVENTIGQVFLQCNLDPGPHESPQVYE